MSFKTTGILALLLALLGGYIYFFEIRGWEEQEEARQAARRLAQVSKGQVVRLRLETPEDSIVATKEGFRWTLVEPIEARGDYDILEGLIDAAGNLEKAGVAADSAQVAQPDFSLADYGLDNPTLRLAFTDEDSVEHGVAFGDRSPTGGYFYVKMSGDDRIYLAAGHLYWQFDLSMMDLRDNRYVRFDPDRLTKIVLTSGDRSVAVRRKAFQWEMIEPVQDLGDPVGIGQFVTNLRDARVQEYADTTDLGDTGLDDPWFTIELVQGEDDVRGLAFGDKTGSRAYRRYFARAFGSPHVFKADSLFVHQMIQAGDHFRTKDVFAFDRNAVDRVEMIFPDSSLVFDRLGFEKWDVTSHPAYEIPGRRIEDFIDEITALRAKSYVSEGLSDEKRQVFETNGIRIRLLGQDRLLREVAVGAVGRHLFAATNDREQIVEIERYFLETINDVRIHPKPEPESATTPE